MAALNCLFSTPAATVVTVPNATTKTIAQIAAPTNQRARVLGFSVFGASNSPGLAGVEFRLTRQTNAGTMTAGTPVVTNVGSETPQVTCAYNATAEPSGSSVVAYGKFNPQSGYVVFSPMGQEVIVAGGGRLGLVATNNSGASVDITFAMGWEE